MMWTRQTTHATGLRLVTAPPLIGAWFVDASRDGTGTAAPRVMVMSNRRLWMPHMTVSQGGRIIATRRLFQIARPGRPMILPSSLVSAVESAGGEVFIGLMDNSYIPFDLRGSGFHLPLCGP